MAKNRTVRLKQRPIGLIAPNDFTISDEEIDDLGEDQILVKNQYLSLDPAMRGWLSGAKSYIPAVKIGDVVRGFTAGVVKKSNHPDFEKGDAVTGLLGVQTRAIANADDIQKVDVNKAPLERWIGGLGMPGLTAVFGLLDIGKPKKGETLVVSAASGAVGSIVGQIGKIKGLNVVGIVGGPEKCKTVTDELGFDACIDYKADNLYEDLKAACPDGIDIYFESVGGEIFDTVLTQMNKFGRIPVCGMISGYNATELAPGPKNLRSILVNRLTVQGFIVFDFIEHYEEALEALATWHAAGKLKMREDIREDGIDAFPQVVNELYTGGNNGKLILKL